MTNRAGDGQRPRAPRPPRRATKRSDPSRTERARGKGGVWGRIAGTDRRAQIQAQKFRPYSYQSNSITIRYVAVFIAVWVALAVGLAFNDRSNATLYEGWHSEGLTVIPPTGVSPDDLLAYAAEEGIECRSLAEINALTPGCERVFEIRRNFVDSQDRSNLLFAGLIFATVAAAFPFSTFTNRASRNLLTLRAAGQKISPEWAVFWFFIPVMNAVRPVQVFRELFKASDPTVDTSDERSWQRSGRAPLMLYAWWPLFVVSIFFNPITIPRIWAGTRDELADLVTASNLLFWSDMLMAMMGVASLLMLVQLHRLQEAKHAKVGDITVTRPMPGDPFKGPSTGGSATGDFEGEER